MRPGDKVRLLRGVEEGHVVRIINPTIVEIETTDGFTMPVLKSELVLVASEEKDFFEKPNTEIVTTTASTIQHGVYLAFEAEEGKSKAEVYFINNTPFTFLTCISEVDNSQLFNTKISNICEAFSYIKIGNYILEQMEKWPSIAFHLTKIDTNGHEPEFIKKIYSPKAKNFFKNKQTSPLRKNPAYVFNLLEGTVKIDTTKLIEQLFESVDTGLNNRPISSEKREIDLHIEVLREDFEFLQPEVILPIQLEVFEKALDDAIAHNCPEITFIHGVGSGKLKYEISKVLSKHPHVKYYQDADKQKFGYGATKAVLG